MSGTYRALGCALQVSDGMVGSEAGGVRTAGEGMDGWGGVGAQGGGPNPLVNPPSKLSDICFLVTC